MSKEKNQNKTLLKSWVLTKPILFALWCMALGLIFGLGYGLIQTVLNIESYIPIYVLFALSFILPACYMIQKLPHDKMNQNDFVAITNGTSFVSIIASFLTIFVISFSNLSLQRDIIAMYILRPTMFSILLTLSIFISLYLVGVTISGIYAKYKRAVTLGVSPWKVILSMPFAFLLMWTPGYLTNEKDVKSNLEIQSNWFNKLNKWVLNNLSNTLFMFLLLLFCKSVISGFPTLTLSALLIIIYALWYTKHKSDFIKNINDGYALTAVGINLAILLAVIIQLA